MGGVRRRYEATEVYSSHDDSSDSERPSKRLRLSTDATASEPEDDDDDERDSTIDAAREASRPPDYYISTQEQFQTFIDEEENEEAEERRMDRARRKLDQENEAFAGNQEREHGIIESVECQNFMCHEHLEIKLGPLINFIVGHNGSGKSAVLTAITLCLGGKATSTNRGQNLKSFVKVGKENCVLKVRIKNQGQGAYRNDVYGDSILVERHFSVHGNSSFKIKSESGRVISTKRSELDEISDFYALQLENPVNVLTQDQARSFLSNSTAENKYSFFIRGVQLEQLNTDYNIVFDNLQWTKGALPNVFESLKQLRKVKERAEAKLARTKQQANLREQHGSVMRQYCWSQVEGQERTIAEARAEVAEAQAKIETREREAQEKSDAYTRKNEACQQANTSLEQIQEGRASMEADRDEKKDEFQKVKALMGNDLVGQRQLKGDMEIAEQTCKKREELIEEEKARLEALTDGSQATLVQAVEDAKTELENVKAEAEQHPSKRTRLERDRDTADLREKDVKAEVDRRQSEFNDVTRKLASLQQNNPDPMKGYHPSVRQLLKMIDNEKRWRKKPVGPVGMHVKLNQPKWSPLLERYLGGMLNNFIVTCKADEVLLSNLIKKANYRCHVMIENNQTIDTSRIEPEEGVLTVLRVLTIDNRDVRNQLIINQTIEKTILIEQRSDALAWLNGRPNSSNQVMCFQENSRNAGHLVVGEASSRKIDPILPARNQQAARMTTDNAAQISMQKEIVEAARTELRKCQQELTQAGSNAYKCKQALTAHDRASTRLKARKQECDEQLANAKEALEAATTSDSPLENYRDELREQEEIYENLKGQYAGSIEHMKTLGRDNKEHKHALDAAQQALDDHAKQVEKARETLQRAETTRERALREKNEALAAVQTMLQEKCRHETAVETQEKHLEEFIEGASQISARVPVPANSTPNGLQRKMERINEQIERAQREVGGNEEQIAQQVTKAANDCRMAERRYEQLLATEGALSESVHERSKIWKRFRSEISARARCQFQYLLAERGFDGMLDFRHKLRSLDLKVQPDPKQGQGTSGRAGRQTKTLSGGEKSFSTICLLLALWDAMGSPIRCLDEFDVFMDSVNRDQSMKMIVMAARRSVGKQFILITPQSMGALKEEQRRDVKVHLMREPERGQTALRFGR